MLRNLSASSSASFSSYENQLIRNESTTATADLSNDEPTQVIIETIASTTTAPSCSSSSSSSRCLSANTKSRDLKEYENESTISLILESNHKNHHNFKHESVNGSITNNRNSNNSSCGNRKSFLFKTGLKPIINSSLHHYNRDCSAKELEEVNEKKTNKNKIITNNSSHLIKSSSSSSLLSSSSNIAKTSIKSKASVNKISKSSINTTSNHLHHSHQGN